MELRDLIVTPIVILIVYAIAYKVRPLVTDEVNRKYFIPALTVRIIGALAVGFVYQFYYGGGDTFTYHTHGSRHIWEAFMDSPLKGFDLLFSDGTHQPETFSYSSKIWQFRNEQSLFIIRVAAVLDLFTFSSYSGTAILFAVISFTGAWLLFLTFYQLNPQVHKWIAFSSLFIPTVFFWGSGIFKDTLTLAALEIATFYVFKTFVEGKFSMRYIICIIICCWVIYSIKIYILLTFLPATILWISSKSLAKTESMMLRILLVPITLFLTVIFGYFAVKEIGSDDPRYSLETLAETARVTAYDIRYWTGRDAGSGYSLGELDGSFTSMIRLAPQAIIVSLFRPYLWEVRNPLMLLSALEGLALLALTIYIIIKVKMNIILKLVQPEILFCLIFSIIFAFAVGVSTFNFGTLSRYKIPLLPFYCIGIGLIYYYSNKDKKLSEFEETE